MRLPRDISGDDLTKALAGLGYRITRQRGSHMRLTSHERGSHHVTVPRHDPLRIGTLRSILDDVARHFDVSVEQLTQMLFER